MKAVDFGEKRSKSDCRDIGLRTRPIKFCTIWLREPFPEVTAKSEDIKKASAEKRGDFRMMSLVLIAISSRAGRMSFEWPVGEVLDIPILPRHSLRQEKMIVLEELSHY